MRRKVENFKGVKMTRMELQLPAELRQRLDMIAASQSVSTSTVIRLMLNAGSKELIKEIGLK